MGGDYDPPIIYQLSHLKKLAFLVKFRHLVKIWASAQKKCVVTWIFRKIKCIFSMLIHTWGRPAVNEKKMN